MADVPAPRSDTVSPSTFVITNADWTSRHYPGAYLIVVEADHETSRLRGKLPIVRLRLALFVLSPVNVYGVNRSRRGKLVFPGAGTYRRCGPKFHFSESPGIDEERERATSRRTRSGSCHVRGLIGQRQGKAYGEFVSARARVYRVNSFQRAKLTFPAR